MGTGRNIVGVGHDSFAIHEISTNLDFMLTKIAFRKLREVFFSTEVKQDSSMVGNVFLYGLRVDVDVVHVHVRETTAVRGDTFAIFKCTRLSSCRRENQSE